VNGRGDEHADIMVIGEAPGQDEDIVGKPFAGDSGKLLAYMLVEAGIEPSSVYLSNAVRCRPPGNRKPKTSEIKACRDYLFAEIAQVKPRVLLTVGATALEALYKKAKLADVAGQILTQPTLGLPIIPTYHPAWLMRGNWTKTEIVIANIAKAKRIVDGTIAVQDLDEARQNAKVIRTVEQVEALADFLLSDEIEVVTTDSETTGLSWLDDEVLCVSFSALYKGMAPIRAGVTVPLHRTDKSLWPMGKNGKPKIPSDWRQGHVLPYWSPEDETKVVAALGRIFDSGKAIAIQNASFDIRMFERDKKKDMDLAQDLRVAYGWHIGNLRYDTMLFQRVVNESLPANESMLLNFYSDLPYYETEVREQSQDKHRMDLADNEVVWSYAALDSDGLARILPELLLRADKQGVTHIHNDISIPMVRACWQMTRRGVLIDIEYFEKLVERFQQLTADAERSVMEAYGHGYFNLNAPKQIQNVLFRALALPQSGRKTKGGKGCENCKPDIPCDEHDQTGKDALLDIKAIMVARGQEPHPILDAIIAWKALNKQRGTYIDGSNGEGGLLQFIRKSRRAHPEYGVNRADTGRLGAYAPPIQTWPKEVADEVLGETKALRRVWISSTGWLMEADWSQGELWVVGYESGCKILMDLLTSGRDVHTYVARKLCESGISDKFPHSAQDLELSEYEWKKLHNDLRKDAKVFVFGLDYGMTEAGIAERLHCQIREGKELRDFYIAEIFPELEDFFEYMRDQIETGLTHNWNDRLGHFPSQEVILAHSRRGEQDWEESIRKGTNMPIQSGLNDIHMPAHLAVEQDSLFAGRYTIVTAVHDSILGEANAPDTEGRVKLAWQLKEKMEGVCKTLLRPNGQPLDWAIPVEVSWGPSWAHLDNVLGSDGQLLLVEGEKQNVEEDEAE